MTDRELRLALIYAISYALNFPFRNILGVQFFSFRFKTSEFIYSATLDLSPQVAHFSDGKKSETELSYSSTESCGPCSRRSRFPYAAHSAAARTAA